MNSTINIQTLFFAHHDKELQLFYQLQFNLLTNNPISAEALLRSAGDKAINEAPYKLLNNTERSGRIEYLTYWIINKALSDFDSIYLVHKIEHIAVNVSPSDIIKKDFVKNVLALLVKNNKHGKCLVLEITEKLPIANLRNTIKNITALQAVGVKVVLDDFGTGYTSLPLLGKLPIAGIKLDKVFSDNIEDKKYRAISECLIDLTKKLDISILIEGIENQRVHNIALHMGFTRSQGFHYHCPQSKKELLKKIT